jgi:hypothetical protein
MSPYRIVLQVGRKLRRGVEQVMEEVQIILTGEGDLRRATALPWPSPPMPLRSWCWSTSNVLGMKLQNSKLQLHSKRGQGLARILAWQFAGSIGHNLDHDDNRQCFDGKIRLDSIQRSVWSSSI